MNIQSAHFARDSSCGCPCGCSKVPRGALRVFERLARFARSPGTFCTCSSLAPPPTSKKLAGLPPFSWMMSMVLMASPAPLTMHPMFPSSPI